MSLSNHPILNGNRTTVRRGDLDALNEALRKAAEVGYQTPAGTSGGDAGSYAPLVPQSIQNTLVSQTFTAQNLSIWKDIAKENTRSTLHEVPTVEDHGANMDPFFAEGSVPGTNVATYDRESVRIKYLAERREVTDVANLVGIVGSDPNAVAAETQRGTLSLLKKVEQSLWHADESLNPLAFDGLFKQMESKAPNNVTDLQGSTISAQLLSEVISELYSEPYYGEPNKIYLEPRLFGEMQRQAYAYGRNDNSGRVGQLIYGPDMVAINGPNGPVPLRPSTFLNNSTRVPLNADGTAVRSLGLGDTQPSIPSLSVAVAAVADPSSGFNAADAGDYRYAIEAVGAKGLSPIYLTPVVSVAAGDKVTFTIAAPAVAGTYYRIYRTDKDGDFSTARKIAEVAYAGGATAVEDLNATIPGTSSIFVTNTSSDCMQWVQLLDFLRRPLAEVQTSQPFLLMLFGAPMLLQAKKCWALHNVGYNRTL